MGIDYKLVRISNIIIAVAWNFLIYKYWVYKQDEMPVVLPSAPV